MKIRDTVLDDQHAFITPSLTWTFPINIVDPVTEFKVDFQIETNPLGGVTDDWYWPEPMPYMIREIAIIDGSEVIFALNGAQAFAMSCFDQDKWIPFDHRGDDFIRLMKNWFTEVQMHGFCWVEDVAHREHLCGDLSSGVVISNTGSFFISPNNWLGNVYHADVRDFNGLEPDEAHRIEGSFHGTTRTPLDCFCYPFGDQSDPADWLQTAPMGNLRLILTHAAEDWEGVTGYGLTQIVTQQAHPY